MKRRNFIARIVMGGVALLGFPRTTKAAKLPVLMPRLVHRNYDPDDHTKDAIAYKLGGAARGIFNTPPPEGPEWKLEEL